MCASRSIVADRHHTQLLLDVARMYYIEERSQSEIAEAIGYSRPTVSRLITEARRRQMVRISIEHPLDQAFDLERQLERRFGLQVAAVASASDAPPHRSVGRLAASLIAEAGHAHTILALSNGTSVASVVKEMPRQRWPFSNVVQMVGSLAQVGTDLVDSPELCKRMARRLGGTHRPMPVPLVMGSVSLAEAMRHEELVLTTLELAARSDIALVGVGAVGPQGRSGAILRPYMTSAAIADARRSGAVAHVCGHYFNAAGEHIRDRMCNRVISMPPERLGGIGLSIAVVWGLQKVQALGAALRAGLVKALVTDEHTAHLVLAQRS